MATDVAEGERPSLLPLGREHDAVVLDIAQSPTSVVHGEQSVDAVSEAHAQAASFQPVENRPSQRPPRNLKLPPASYLPPAENPLLTVVATTRASPDPWKLDKVLPFTTAVSPVVRVVSPSIAARDAAAVNVRAAPSAFWGGRVDGRMVHVSDKCKFTLAEQEGLLEFRRRLVTACAEMEALRALVAGSSGGHQSSVDQRWRPSGSGLPAVHDTERCRFEGRTFSQEDASAELHDDRFLKRLAGYIDFVDAALADELDPPPSQAKQVSKTRELPEVGFASRSWPGSRRALD